MQMELSEAIRLGAMTTYQIQAQMWEKDGDVVVGACAIGCTLLAAGLREDARYVTDLCPAFPIMRQLTDCPCGKHQKNELGAEVYFTIVPLNDSCNWTREAIADWVEHEERVSRQSPASASPAVVQPCALSGL